MDNKSWKNYVKGRTVKENLTVRSTMSGKERINVGILKIWKFNWRFYLEDSLKKFSKKVDFSGFFYDSGIFEKKS